MRTESCNKLSHQLQKQWPTQANFPTVQSCYLRLFNQRWQKARCCCCLLVLFFPKESNSATSRTGLSVDSSVYPQIQGINCLIMREDYGSYVKPESPAVIWKGKTKMISRFSWKVTIVVFLHVHVGVTVSPGSTVATSTGVQRQGPNKTQGSDSAILTAFQGTMQRNRRKAGKHDFLKKNQKNPHK